MAGQLPFGQVERGREGSQQPARRDRLGRDEVKALALLELAGSKRRACRRTVEELDDVVVGGTEGGAGFHVKHNMNTVSLARHGSVVRSVDPVVRGRRP